LSQAEVEILPDETTAIEAAEEMKSKYSIEYLKKMIQGAKLADKAVVQFSKDYPLKLDYTVKDKMQLANEFFFALFSRWYDGNHESNGEGVQHTDQ
jgi:DNA polymerase III sliding clamp (beta) subunit (PCNA family)